MKIQELREMKTEALHNELDRLRRHLYDLRAQKVTEKLANPNQLGQAKQDIARIFTVLSERGETGIEEAQYHLESQATHRRGG